LSRGLGRVQSKLLEIFAERPRGIFQTSELCREIYGSEQVHKKHRVAVLRALKSIAANQMPQVWRQVLGFERSDDEWFDHRTYPKRSRDCAPASSPRPRKR
jgi:hypothetical protein